jgi:hypothetical protein
VNDWNQVFLGIIAVATAMMTIIQVGAIVFLARTAAQVREIAGTIQKDIRPLISRANAVAEEASKTAALATLQAQKIDRLVTDLTRRVDETSIIIQQAIVTPAREGMAILAALRAGFASLRGFRNDQGRPKGADEEDALFIG